MLESLRKSSVIGHGKYRKWASRKTWTECKYHVKDIKDVSHKTVKILGATNQFTVFPFCVPHVKPHGKCVLSKHYHLLFYPKLDHGKFVIQRIPCACVACTNMLDNPDPLVWSTQNNHATNLLLTAHTGLC